ncbi:hypothetical protein [Alteromonas phage P24]|nr:hypothetical protein [Alteromonas phage P24]
MIEKLECTCIEAYKTRKMRDPNCCACSCDHNDLIEQLAKANERVSDLESKLEAFTQEARIQACELDTQKGIVQSVQDKFNLRVYDFNISKALDIALNKFAIEKKVEAINEALDYYEELKASEEPIGAGSILHVCLGRLISQQKQLRKEQE